MKEVLSFSVHVFVCPMQTLFVKASGIIFAVAGGLAVGKVGAVSSLSSLQGCHAVWHIQALSGC